MLKVDPSGNVLWARRAGGTNRESGLDIALDDEGNIYLVGKFQGTCVIGTASLLSAGGHDVFVAKLDNGGNWLWAVRGGNPGEDHGYSIAVDASANAFITGQEIPNFASALSHFAPQIPSNLPLG